VRVLPGPTITRTALPPRLTSQGLGKTVQCVSFLGLLAERMTVRGPFLVVVPLSVVPNWIKEFKRWACLGPWGLRPGAWTTGPRAWTLGLATGPVGRGPRGA
jgi:hypothetical protein